MRHRTQTAVLLAFAAFLTAVLCAPAIAQEEEENGTAAPAQTEAVKKPAVTAKKPAAKKKAAKKNKAARPEAVSEYKFQNQDAQLSYKFDRKGDPIVKKARPQEGSSKTSRMNAAMSLKRTKERPIPKLQGKRAPAGSAASYVCPMADYEGDKPGQCPKCGMALVEKK